MINPLPSQEILDISRKIRSIDEDENGHPRKSWEFYQIVAIKKWLDDQAIKKRRSIFSKIINFF